MMDCRGVDQLAERSPVEELIERAHPSARQRQTKRDSSFERVRSSADERAGLAFGVLPVGPVLLLPVKSARRRL